MTTVRLGQNLFVDCHTLIAWNDRAILRAEGGLENLLLDTTGLGEGTKAVRVAEGAASGADVRVIASDVTRTIVVADEALLFATAIGPDTVHIKLDLRPLGLNIFDDVAGLHVGKNLIAHNSFTGSQIAIRLT